MILEIPLGIMYYLDCCVETVSFLGYELTKAIHNIVGVHMITVFTPTYNRVHTIVRTFESLQAQTDKDFEWVVVDDGSSDNTLDVLTQLKEKAEFPVIFQYQKNAGKHVAINLGVQMIGLNQMQSQQLSG